MDLPRDLTLTNKVIEIGRILSDLDLEDAMTVIEVSFETLRIMKMGADHDAAPKKE